jgi:hypothetical protein
MANTTPGEVNLNRYLRELQGFGTQIQGGVDAFTSAVTSNPDSLLGLASMGARAFFPVSPALAASAARATADFITPDPIEIGAARRGPKNEIQLYAGDNYGWQSVPSYTKILPLPDRMQGNVNPDKRFPVNTSPNADKKPESSTTPPGGNNPSLPGFDSATQNKIGYNPTNLNTNIGKETANPNFDLREIIRENYDRMAANQETNWERMQLASQDAQRSAMAKTEANTARQIELENIRAWRDITQAKITTNAAIAAATAAAMTAAQRPDAGYMNAAAQLFQASAAPYARAAARVG